MDIIKVLIERKYFDVNKIADKKIAIKIRTEEDFYKFVDIAEKQNVIVFADYSVLLNRIKTKNLALVNIQKMITQKDRLKCYYGSEDYYKEWEYEIIEFDSFIQ